MLSTQKLLSNYYIINKYYIKVGFNNLIKKHHRTIIHIYIKI